MSYPPAIAQNDFIDADPPALDVTVHCALTAFVCNFEAFAIVRDNTTAAGETASHGGEHDDLAADAASRHRIAPDNDALFFTWSLEGHERIDSAVIEIFQRNDANALWTKTIQWGNAGQRAAMGWTAFRGLLDNDDNENAATGASAVATASAAPGGGFPDGYLTAAQAPYKVRMTLHTSDDDTRFTTRVRWLYLDVVFASIGLTLGAERIVPQGAAPGDYGFNRRNRRLRAAMAAALGQGASVVAADNAAVNVPLDGNVFTIDTPAHQNEMTTNAGYTAWTAQWRTGPLIPIVARPLVRNFQGNAVFSPYALGAGKLLWDWEGADLDTDALHELTLMGMRAFQEINPDTWPAAKQNVLDTYGGKRGNGSIFDTADTGYQTYDDNTVGHFPYRMDACGTRLGAAFSRSGTTAGTRGQSGVVFTPSIVARDRFTLRCYFPYGRTQDWDVDSTAEQLLANLPSAVPYATTGVFTVQRIVKVQRHWTMYRGQDMDGAAFDWAALADDYFAPAGITLDYSAVDGTPTSIDQAEFRAGFAAAITGLPAIGRSAFVATNGQAADDARFAVRFNPRNDLRGSINVTLTAAFDAISGNAFPQNGGTAGSLDRIQARLDLYCLVILNERQNRGATPDAPLAGRGPAVDDFNRVLRPFHFAGDPQLASLAREAVRASLAWCHGVQDDVAAEAAGALVGDIREQGDAAALEFIKTQASLDSDRRYYAQTKEWSGTVVTAICQYINDQHLYDADDGDGLQVFQFDFLDNFDGFDASGLAFSTNSNRNNCPECNAPLDGPQRAARVCAACNAAIRTNAAVNTQVPWRLVTATSYSTAWSLKQNADKYLFITAMEGACPQILVAHEIGHQLFLPHAPYGFRAPDPVPRSGIWLALRTKFFFGGLGAFLQGLEESTIPGGNHAVYHAPDGEHQACIMGYNFTAMASLHFCWKCVMRLRGWNGTEVAQL